MKIKGIVPILISISVALGLFIFTYVQFPTTNIFRILGQGFGSLVVGSIVYLVAAFIAKLIYAILGAGSKQKLDIKNINHNANYLAETENQLSEGSIAIAQKFKQDDLSQIRSNDGKELIEGAIENNKYVDECREEAIHQDKKIILEEGRPYLKYRPHNCPYCDSTNIGESMIQAVKDEKERKILGYSYLWEGRCAD